MPMIKVAYYKFNNLGDRLSPELVHWMSGDEIECEPSYKAELFAVGSILNFYSPFYLIHKGFFSWLKRKKIQARRITSKKMHIWGSGFLTYPSYEPSIFLRNVEWNALRGKVSLEILKKLPIVEPLHFAKNFTFGDPGLLYEKLYPGERNIQYDLGIIPHERDQKVCCDWIIHFQKIGLRVKYIDVFSSPKVFFNEIRTCEVILSSSLHGLIIADSLGIPNRHIVFSTLGYSKKDYFLKFNDYYSIYAKGDLNMPMDPKEAETLGNNIITEIKKKYHISSHQMEDCRSALLNAFPKEYVKY